jgi:hypothetical protein
MDGES